MINENETKRGFFMSYIFIRIVIYDIFIKIMMRKVNIKVIIIKI